MRVKITTAKQTLPNIYGQIQYNSNGLEYVPVLSNIMAIYLIKNTPTLKPLVNYLLPVPVLMMHCFYFLWDENYLGNFTSQKCSLTYPSSASIISSSR